MSRLFDPLGWLAPVVVRAKILFQLTWLKGFAWDVPLDDVSIERWSGFQDELSRLEELRIPRYLNVDAGASLELHGFADASERAYAAVIYMRALYQSGDCQVRLVVAKTKVAPLKQITLPRLELCAAHLFARLMASVRRTLEASQIPAHLWTDSTLALGWIQGHPSRWKTFVANRVSEIQTVLPRAQWHHLPGVENPADCASRSLPPAELVAHPLWWTGPPWLAGEPSSWPAPPPASLADDLPEGRKQIHAMNVRRGSEGDPDELTRFSSLTRLLRVTAWCRRWLRRGEIAPSTAPGSLANALTASELEEARLTWLRVVQAEFFPAEIGALERGELLSKRHSLIKLSPFVDPQGVLRVGDRIKHSLLAYDERHPAILPSGSHLTGLIANACHRRTLHGGVQLTLGAIRQQYWIPLGRALVKSTIRRCVACVRWRAASPQQFMGDLPRQRVQPSRPFVHAGVDYAGPVLLRSAKGRGHRSHKGFIAVFVCLGTKAVHLELVTEYSSDAFLAAFRRFVSRRGLCLTLHSDCGTNFVGADKRLREFFAASSPEQRLIAGQLADEGIRWHFNPPAAPHFGGLWEAAVKSLKHHLRRVLGDATLTYEELSILLTQVEACLNSRPLQALTDDPEDLSALTPGHLLIGSALNAVPEPVLSETPHNRLTRWQLLQQMRDHFWERWSKEYLSSLLSRSKWWKTNDQIRVGRLCLIRSENSPPSRWPLARIIRTHPGEDGKVRMVSVRTAISELTRPIAKIILLPISDNSDLRQE